MIKLARRIVGGFLIVLGYLMYLSTILQRTFYNHLLNLLVVLAIIDVLIIIGSFIAGIKLNWPRSGALWGVIGAWILLYLFLPIIHILILVKRFLTSLFKSPNREKAQSSVNTQYKTPSVNTTSKRTAGGYRELNKTVDEICRDFGGRDEVTAGVYVDYYAKGEVQRGRITVNIYMTFSVDSDMSNYRYAVDSYNLSTSGLQSSIDYAISALQQEYNDLDGSWSFVARCHKSIDFT